MQAERHELLLQMGQVVAHLVDQKFVVHFGEGDPADLQFAGHAGGQFSLEVQFGDELPDSRDGSLLAGVVLARLGGFVALDQLAQLQQLVVERRRRQRRGQVVYDDGAAAALGLDSLTHAVHDVDVGVGEVPLSTSAV